MTSCCEKRDPIEQQRLIILGYMYKEDLVDILNTSLVIKCI